MIVNYDEYSNTKCKFMKKHNYDFTVNTSEMDEYGCYRKEYVFDDNSIWYESMAPEYVEYEVTVNCVRLKETVKMLRTEFWSTDDSKSKKYYEKF